MAMVNSETLWERRQLESFAPMTNLNLAPLGSGKKPSKKTINGDRFIPNRSAIDLPIANFMSRNGNNPSKENKCNNNNNISIASPVKDDYKRKLAQHFLAPQEISSPSEAKILAFKNRPPAPSKQELEEKEMLLNANIWPINSERKRKIYRHIPQTCDRILDAPDLVDDYYLNLLDWSSLDTLAVALGPTLYLWQAQSGSIQMLTQTTAPNDHVTGVSWSADGRHLAVGTHNSEVQIWDVARSRQIRSFSGHDNRVGSLSWNGDMLSSGCKDGLILNHDVRLRDHVTSSLRSHEQEVCGLKWSNSGTQLASGGNDNQLYIWDSAMISSSSNVPSPSSPFSPGTSPSSNARRYLHRLSAHGAAVKALAWCPFQANLLASGGGSADRCIKFWNTNSGTLLNSIDTHSQVCALQWSKHEKEIVSSHGYSLNQLCVWKYPSMVKLAELTGHSARVLHMAQSPDGNTIVSAAADETLRFWKILGTNENKSKLGKGKIVPTASLGFKKMPSIR